MKVFTSDREYSLYIGADGVWTMHTFDPTRPEGSQYLDTHCGVNLVNPFLSSVEYDAWR